MFIVKKQFVNFSEKVGLQLMDSPRFKVNRIIDLWHTHNEEHCFYFTVECVRLTSNLGEFILVNQGRVCICV